MSEGSRSISKDDNSSYSVYNYTEDGLSFFLRTMEGCKQDGTTVFDMYSKLKDQKCRRNKMSRSEILDSAKNIVCGAREQEYSSPENSFTAIAELWNAFLFNKIRDDEVTFRITPDDVGLMMALFKIARVQTGRYKADSFIDACGYLACAGEIAGIVSEDKDNVT